MTNRHDYPELADPPAVAPAEVVQTRCPMCAGIGYRTQMVTISGEEQAARCCWCGGTGYYWVEVDHAV
jgi:hypothetical protein